MQDCVEWGSPVILYCQNGGIIGDEADDYEEGLQTVSLIAAHELAARGWGCEAIKVRSVRWSPHGRVGVVNADP
jgi:hypothetical protein|eukprot:31483-Pelagococcus_subviridis.AAC.2